LCDLASRRLQRLVSLPLQRATPPVLIPAARTGSQPSRVSDLGGRAAGFRFLVRDRAG